MENNKTILWFDKKQFNELMFVLEEASLTEKYAMSSEMLKNKIYRYGHCEKNNEEIRVEFYPSETRDLLWLFQSYIGKHCQNLIKHDYYEEYESKHNQLKQKPNNIPLNVACYLYGFTLIGYEALIKNKNGDIYLVDHLVYDSDLYKDKECWKHKREDVYAVHAFEQLEKYTKTISKFVHWSDSSPVDIIDLLEEQGVLEQCEKHYY